MFFALGVLMGALTKYLSQKLIVKRGCEYKDSKMFQGKLALLLWCLISGIGYLIIGILEGNKIEHFLIFSTLLSLSAVDFKIKKIPNELLLLLLIIKIVMICMNGFDFSTSIIGMFMAMMIFLIPAKLGKSIGMGDIKLSMIIGFSVGIYGFLIAMLIMGISVTFYWLYLIFAKKGNLLSQIPMGPYISLGFMISCLVLNTYL